MIGGGLKDKVTVYRMQGGVGGRLSMQPTGETYKCRILPLDQTASVAMNIAIGQGYEAYLQPGCDVKVGDKLVDAEGEAYNVSGIQKFKNSGLASHIRLMLEIKSSNG